MSDDAYYRALAVVDRIGTCALEKYKNWLEFTKACGLNERYFYNIYNQCVSMRFSTLIKFAQNLNLSVEYLLTGKNKAPFNNDCSLKYITKINCGKYAKVKHQLKIGKSKTLNIRTLFQIEQETGKDIMKILRGKYEQRA